MWYVVWTTTGKEEDLMRKMGRYVDEGLYTKCWVPRIVERQKWDGVWKDVEKLMFPGYLFLDTERPEEVHAALARIPGFAAILKEDDGFTPLTEQEEYMIRALTGEDGTVRVSTGLIEGGVLRVTDGPLKGWEKYIVRTDRHKRKAYLNVDVLGNLRKFSAGLEIIGKS